MSERIDKCISVAGLLKIDKNDGTPLPYAQAPPEVVEHINDTNNPHKITAAITGWTHNLQFTAINPATVNDGSLVVGCGYKIVTVGTSDFTTIGASANTVGIIFTATGTDAGGNGTLNAIDHDTVYWTSGDIKLSNGTVYNISAGNTGNMVAITYIFLDTEVSETELQMTTIAANSIGGNRILIAVAQNVDTKGCALFQVFNGKALGGLGKRINDSDIDTLSIAKDTTPQLGGELDAQNNSIGFTQQVATGTGTTTIDWKRGNKFKFTFGAQNETFTFTAPTKPCNLLLVLVQDETGSRTATWPTTVKWVGGGAPTLSNAANAIDIISFYFDGNSYYGAASLNFS